MNNKKRKKNRISLILKKGLFLLNFTKFYEILRIFTCFCVLHIFEFFKKKSVRTCCIPFFHVFFKEKCVDMVHSIRLLGATQECAMLYVGRLINMEQISTHCNAHTCQHHRVQTVMDDTATAIINTFMLPSLEHVHTLVTHITTHNTQDIGLWHWFLSVGKPVW